MTDFDHEYEYLTRVCEWPSGSGYSEAGIANWVKDFERLFKEGDWNLAGLRFKTRFAMLVADRHPGLALRRGRWWVCAGCGRAVDPQNLVRLLDRECSKR